MDLTGQTLFHVSPERLAQALHDPEMLRRMIPACTAVIRQSPTAFAVKIERAAGPVTLRLTAHLSVMPLGPDRYRLHATGNSALAGRVEADLTLTLAPVPGGTSLSHSGHLTATGLARRLLSARADLLAERTDAMFRDLSAAIEAQHPRLT